MRRLTLAIAGLAIAGAVVAVSSLRTPERLAEAPRVTGPARVEPSAPAATPSSVTTAATRDPAAPLAPSGSVAVASRPDPMEALKRATAGGDDHELVEAVELVVDAGAVEALPTLSSIELREKPHSAPAVIGAIAALAKETGPRERREAAITLARWFGQERKREGNDAAGNTTTLIDALADTGQREAVEALVAALDEQKLPLNNETLIVQRLAELRQPSAKPAVARFQTRVMALPPAEGIDEELRREAIAAARDALQRLGG